MNTPEIGALGREVLRITGDGRMIKGEGLSTEKATQQAAKLLIQAFEQEIQKMVDARLAVDTARLDWLLNITRPHIPYQGGWLKDRAAIDIAMKEASK